MNGPKFVRYFGPVLRALDQLGGSGRPSEVYDRVAEELSISDDEMTEKLPSGSPRFKNQVAWARFYLAKAGYIDASQRGVWSLTDVGRSHVSISHEEALMLFRDVHSRFAAVEEQEITGEEVETEEEAVAPEETPSPSPGSYRKQLQDTLMSLSPSGFERFCQRLLRESGFEQVSVTGRSGDGGIDGIGILQVNALVSFKVLFQCKRYTGAIVPSQVRDFRGAMMGRADKGIIITTGTFTGEAKKEAVRDGVPPIELVDGEKLIDMCENLELGLKPLRTFEIDHQFFHEFKI
ncbi:restriction endonuclease [bacterium]|nr:MAG: restriction endonuclease [bacterium]